MKRNSGATFRVFACARRHLESGSAEGEFAFTIYTPYLFALLLVGLAFALVGFWRIGATMSAERAAAANGVSAQGSNAAVAQAAQQQAFDTWANARGGEIGLSTGPGRRSDTLTFSARATLRTGFLGNWEFTLPGQSERRRERFYSGPAVCETEANCHE
ncbi:MAG: hypothetical protein ABIQ99_01645 [Thermoflexales bacterium]